MAAIVTVLFLYIGSAQAVSLQGNTPAITTSFNITGSRNTGACLGEAPLCNLVADGMLWYAAQNQSVEIDAAVLNAGCVRSDIPVGTITSVTLAAVLPFGDTLCVIDVTGQQLLEAIESACQKAPSPIVPFPQVSGMEYLLYTDVPFDASPCAKAGKSMCCRRRCEMAALCGQQAMTKAESSAV